MVTATPQHSRPRQLLFLHGANQLGRLHRLWQQPNTHTHALFPADWEKGKQQVRVRVCVPLPRTIAILDRSGGN